MMTDRSKSCMMPFYGLIRYNDEPVKKFPPGEEGKRAAVEFAKRLDEFDFGNSTGSLVNRDDRQVFGCLSHVDCSVKSKVVNFGTPGGYSVFCSEEAHTQERASLSKHFQGISAEFADMVDKLIGQGYVTSRVRAELIISCGADEAKKTRVPTKEKISARKGALLKSSQFQFKTLADMMMWANGKMVNQCFSTCTITCTSRLNHYMYIFRG